MFTLEESALLGRMLRVVAWSVICLMVVATIILLPAPLKAQIASGLHSVEFEIQTLAHGGFHHPRHPRG